MRQIVFLFTIVLLSSCNIINPSEKEPTYMTIKDFVLEAGSSEGGNSQNVKDVWVYVNSQFVGAYQLPATFPVLGEGEQLLEIFAGIKINGINGFSERYNFYDRYTTTIDLQPGEDIELAPIFKYTDEAIFVLVEQFDDSPHQLVFDGDGSASEATLEIISGPETLDGSSGYIRVDTANYFFDLGSDILEEYPTTGVFFFLEMDYKTDVQMNLGLVAYDALGNVIFSDFNQGVLPKDEWTKIYFDLSAAMSGLKNLPALSYYRLHFTAALNLNNTEGITEAEIFMDNLKLVTFE